MIVSQPVLADLGRGPTDLIASLQLTVEVAEVMQGVEDELPLWGISTMVVLIPQKIQQAGH